MCDLSIFKGTPTLYAWCINQNMYNMLINLKNKWFLTKAKRKKKLMFPTKTGSPSLIIFPKWTVKTKRRRFPLSSLGFLKGNLRIYFNRYISPCFRGQSSIFFFFFDNTQSCVTALTEVLRKKIITTGTACESSHLQQFTNCDFVYQPDYSNSALNSSQGPLVRSPLVSNSDLLFSVHFLSCSKPLFQDFAPTISESDAFLRRGWFPPRLHSPFLSHKYSVKPKWFLKNSRRTIQLVFVLHI